MPDSQNLFKGLFDSDLVSVISVGDFLLCLVTALVIGIIMTLAYAFRTRCTKSFLVTLSLLPAVVCVIIMMVNGNVGAGVAVAGAFSLVRFRSAPGSAKEIGMIFLAMGAGIIAGMGYLAYAVLFTVIMCGMFVLYNLISGSSKKGAMYKTMNITIPESLDYTGVFDDLFAEYTKGAELVKVKTTNMGSMFRLTYNVTLRDPSREKEFLDKIRERNGNLEITVSKQETSSEEL